MGTGSGNSHCVLHIQQSRQKPEGLVLITETPTGDQEGAPKHTHTQASGLVRESGKSKAANESKGERGGMNSSHQRSA